MTDGPADWPDLYDRGDCRVNPETTDDWPGYEHDCPACGAPEHDQTTAASWGGERFGLPLRRMVDERECAACDHIYLAKRQREGF